MTHNPNFSSYISSYKGSYKSYSRRSPWELKKVGEDTEETLHMREKQLK